MTETPRTHRVVTHIFREYSRSKREREEAQQREQERINWSRRTHNQAWNIVKEHGEEETISVMTGAGGNIIGARLEYVQRKVTPFIQLDLGEENDPRIADICVVEEIEGGPSYSIRHNGFAIKAAFVDKNGAAEPLQEEFTLFHIEELQTTDWNQETVTVEGLTGVQLLLEHIDTALLNKK